MSAPIRGGMWLHSQGNSISGTGNPAGINWMTPAGGALAQIRQKLSPGGPPPPRFNGATVAGSSTVTRRGAVASLAPTVPGYPDVTFTFSGHSGASAQQILADLPTTLLAQVPAGVNLCFVLDDGANDVVNIQLGLGETLADYANFHGQIFDYVRAHYPGALCIDVEVLCLGEVWSAGPSWGANPYDATIALVNAQKATTDAAKGVQLVRWRDNILLPLEVINNPTKLAGGVYVFAEGNDVHPNQRGMVDVMAAGFIQQVGVVP